ncbi:ras-related protein Rab-22A-like [Patiria miniata]|uniref:Uncharacterized protein n=1 Tax=Patiria miniata TaxID=46514 RepID=A0A914B0B4_PATMI|nr:ras-related protein Rab-22A-like [Patiria miniata]
MPMKICLVGDKGVGKSCIAQRLIHDEFNKQVKSTIGRVFFHKELTMKEGTFTVYIWDTAGEERYLALAPLYYRNASAIVLVYDITDEESFSNLQKVWVPAVQSCSDPNIALAVVGNKLDLEETGRGVSTEEARGYADILEAVFLETSAKTGHNVERVFTELVLRISSSQLKDEEEKLKTSIKVSDWDSKPVKKHKSSCNCHR